MTKRKIGVLVMSYGTPENMDRIEAYYTLIRKGRAPSAEHLEDLTKRYESIGGVFPLRKNTDKQVRALETYLNTIGRDAEFICYQGLKYASPFIEDGIRQMVSDGIREAIGIVLAPHYSTMSVLTYIKRSKEIADSLGLSMAFVESYHLHPKLIEALSVRVDEALTRFHNTSREEVRVIFSAHSLPETILQVKDPYPEQLLETSRAICEKTGITNWQFAWQSAGKTGTPWLGPDILDVLRSIHTEEGIQSVLVCPIGFVSDHLEILFDLDIEAKNQAKELGMHLERTDSLNDDPLYIQTLAEEVLRLGGVNPTV